MAMSKVSEASTDATFVFELTLNKIAFELTGSFEAKRGCNMAFPWFESLIFNINVVFDPK